MSIQTSLQAAVSRDNGTTYDTITKVASISGPGMSMNPVDSTHLASSDQFREFLAGFRDGGEIQVSAHLDPESADASNQLLARGDFESGSVTNYRITLQSGPTITAACLVTAWNVDIPEEGMVGLEFTLKVSGKPTYADS